MQLGKANFLEAKRADYSELQHPDSGWDCYGCRIRQSLVQVGS